MSVAQSQELMERLSESGFQVIVYGREDDPEVRRIVQEGKGIALQDPERDLGLRTRKIALVCRAQEPRQVFAEFVSRFFAHNISNIYELRVLPGKGSDAQPQAADASAARPTNGG